MIKIEIIRKDGHIVKLSVKGHANSEDPGKDLVCAAVSAVTMGGANALNPKAISYKIDEKAALIEIETNSLASNNDYQTLETMETQYKTIIESDSKHVMLIEKGN